MTFESIDRRFRRPKPIALECLSCGSVDGVQMESSRTQYQWDGDPDDPRSPNAPIALCRVCAEDHHQHWNMMWAEYRAGLL